MKFTQSINAVNDFAAKTLDPLQSLVALAFRLWVARVFFVSGLTKIQSWTTTLVLFEHEYNVPLLPPALAAYLGTAAELVLPVFIALGLLSRYTVAALFVFNIIAAISYPDISAAGIKDHWVWGVMLLALFVYGPGKLSIDTLLKK